MSKKCFGIIGSKLSHSFSPHYFNNKFQDLKLNNFEYQRFELKKVGDVQRLLSKEKDLSGFNVTIPFKEEIIPFLDKLDPLANRIGAVNVVSFEKGLWVGYNTDYHGFKMSLEKWIVPHLKNALILGTGGASKAIKIALVDLNIQSSYVSRSGKFSGIRYSNLVDHPSILNTHKLIINTTPLGMHPNIYSKPDLPYHLLSENHYLYDLIYNPEYTEFMKEGSRYGAEVKNGYEMLVNQAEESWKIWKQALN
jgi:shikimate dehydrogenase